MDLGLIIMIGAWVVVGVWVAFIINTQKKYHPRALFTLFFAEMWERFSFYGMRALLILYMTKVLFQEMGQSDADARAYGIYGAWGALVYGTPVIGGIIADKILGFRKAILWGGILMALGQFMLIITDVADINFFFIALSLIVIGNGFFKPNISSFLGTFYEQNDPRKDSAFTIFYMGINVGGLLAPLTCGYLGETYDWDWGFGLAGLGMLLGIFVFHRNMAKFTDKGLPPNPEKLRKSIFLGMNYEKIIILGSLLSLPLFASMLNVNELMSYVLGGIGLLILGILLYEAFVKSDKVAGQRIGVILILAFFHTLFWAFFEQAGSSLTLFTERNVDRNIFGTEIRTSVFQSVNGVFIVFLAPLFSVIWRKLRDMRMEPFTPSKFALGLLQLGLGFGALVLGAQFFSVNGMVPVIFLVLAYLLHTTGELCLSPVGLSMITKLSPQRIVGFVMGTWFLSISFAHHLAGIIAKLTAAPKALDGSDVVAIDTLPIYTNVYWEGTLFLFGASALLFVLVPLIRRMMHGIH